MISNFTCDVLDAATGALLPKTTIGGKIYVAAEHGKEIHVRMSIIDPALHLKLSPEGVLNGYVQIEGTSLGYSTSFHNHATSVIFKHVGGCAIVFKKPELAFYFDVDELNAAREAAKHAKTGQIKCCFRQVRIIKEKVAYCGPNFASEADKEKTKPKAKAGLDGKMSGMGVGAGRKLYPNASSSDGPAGPLTKCVTIEDFGSILLHALPAKEIKMLQCQADGVPYVDDEDEAGEEEQAAAAAVAMPRRKQKKPIEIDLTVGDDDDDDSDDDWAAVNGGGGGPAKKVKTEVA